MAGGSRARWFLDGALVCGPFGRAALRDQLFDLVFEGLRALKGSTVVGRTFPYFAVCFSKIRIGI